MNSALTNSLFQTVFITGRIVMQLVFSIANIFLISCFLIKLFSRVSDLAAFRVCLIFWSCEINPTDHDRISRRGWFRIWRQAISFILIGKFWSCAEGRVPFGYFSFDCSEDSSGEICMFKLCMLMAAIWHPSFIPSVPNYRDFLKNHESDCNWILLKK